MSHDPNQQRGIKPSATMAASPSQYTNASGLLPPTTFSNPYQTSYPTNPSAFAYQQSHMPPQNSLQQLPQMTQQSPISPTNSRKRRISEIEDSSMSSSMSSASRMPAYQMTPQSMMGGPSSSNIGLGIGSSQQGGMGVDTSVGGQSSEMLSPVAKKGRTNTPWTPAEEQRLKTMRDAGNSWSEIAKTFPARTEGSVKKHWYKDMHYAEFAEDEGSFSNALLAAIKEYEASKWKVIGAKVGKPAKACEQYAKEHFK